MKIPAPLLLLFALCFFFAVTNRRVAQAETTAPTPVHVGAILDLDENCLVGRMSNVSLAMAVEDFYAAHGSFKTRLVLHTRNSHDNVIGAASAAIDLIKNARVQAIIGPLTSVQTVFVTYLGNKTRVPIVSFSATSPSLSPSRSPYFVRTAINSSSVVAAIAAVAKSFGWREVVPIYEDTEYGTGFLPYLLDAFIGVDTQVTNRIAIPLSARDEDIAGELVNLSNSRTRVFVVHMLPKLGSRLFLQAKKLGMMSEGYAWITTDVLTDLVVAVNLSVVKAMEGVMGLTPYVPETKELRNFGARWKLKFHREYPHAPNVSEPGIYALWAYDTAWALALAIEKVGQTEFGLWDTAVPGSRRRTDLAALGVSRAGPRLLKELLNTTFNKLTGEFKLVDAELQSSIFKFINIVGGRAMDVGFWTSAKGVQRWLNSTKNDSAILNTPLDSIVWPGGSSHAPKGWQIPTGRKLKFAVPQKAGFKEFVNIDGSRFSGCSIEIFDAVMKFLNYTETYDYTSTKAQGMWGSYDHLIDLIAWGEVDGVVGDLTIEANRSKYADFTLPYAESGLGMIVPVKEYKNRSPWIFLKPLTTDLWLGSLTFFIFTGFVVWVIERRTNGDFGGSPTQQMGATFYFTFSTMFFAHREKIESNFSRFAVALWVFVVLIITSSYKASLTSMLTVEQLQPSVSDFNELLKSGGFVGYQDGSFVKGMLMRLTFEESRLKPYADVSSYVDALSRGSQNGGVSAVIDEMPYLKIVMAEHCSKLMMIGPIFKTDGLGFALARGSPLVPEISRAVLNITESDRLPSCLPAKKFACKGETDAFASSKLSFRSFLGLFVITGAVSILSLMVFFVTFLYKNWSELKSAASRGTVWDTAVAFFRLFDQKDIGSPARREESGPKKNCDCESCRTVVDTPALGDGSQTPISISFHSVARAVDEDEGPFLLSPVQPSPEQGRPSSSSEIELAEPTVEAQSLNSLTQECT